MLDGSFTPTAKGGKSYITEFLVLPAALALADTVLEPFGSESDTVGRWGGGSAIPGIVRDESV